MTVTCCWTESTCLIQDQQVQQHIILHEQKVSCYFDNWTWVLKYLKIVYLISFKKSSAISKPTGSCWAKLLLSMSLLKIEKKLLFDLDIF